MLLGPEKDSLGGEITHMHVFGGSGEGFFSFLKALEEI